MTNSRGVLPSADKPLLVTSVPVRAAASVATGAAKLAENLPDALAWARSPHLFGQSAPLRAAFQKIASAAVPAIRPQLPPLVPSATTPVPPPVQVASLETDAIPLPALPETSALVRDVPLPVSRPADLRAVVNPPRLTKNRVVEEPQVAAAPPSGGVGGLFDKIFGSSQPSGPALAYANPQDGLGLPSATREPAPASDKTTAIYDISAKTVYLPDGSRLEAHSGLHEMLDDPRGVHLKMRGATPPATYDLTLREKLFHGVQALRLTPVNSSVYGRAGLLAHTFMLGPNGDSNGCVSFRNYDAFLQAYMRGQVRRLVVVAGRN